MFTLWPKQFVNSAGRVSRDFLNKLRLELAQAVDAGEGGTYSPLSRIVVTGGGVSVNPLGASAVLGTVTRGAAFRRTLRVERATLAGGTTTAVRGTAVDLIDVDAGAANSTSRLVVSVVDGLVRGEPVLVVVRDLLGSGSLRVYTGQVENAARIHEFPGDDPTYLPEWLLLWFDPSSIINDARGSWRVCAHRSVA